MELKTLKDIEAGWDEFPNKFKENLKTEAIKWTKELKDDNEPLNAVGFIKEFFNLTEKDL